MKKQTRTAVYDDELRIEAYRFEGIVQPFPNHFHEYYVIGFIEDGHRVLSCRNQEYALKRAIFFCSIPETIMLAYRVTMAHWITGDLTLPKKSCWTWQKK